jgi:hypothetical protein
MMMSTGPFGPVGCGRPLRGARCIHINYTRLSLLRLVAFSAFRSGIEPELRRFGSGTFLELRRRAMSCPRKGHTETRETEGTLVIYSVIK